MSDDLDPGIWTHRPPEAAPSASSGSSSSASSSSASADLAGGFDFAVKANIEVRGMPANAASPVFGGHLADADALVVAALKRHGGRVAGLTNMHELAFGITSNNAAYHDIHHQHWGIKTNFAQPFFTFWDSLLDTKYKGTRSNKPSAYRKAGEKPAPSSDKDE